MGVLIKFSTMASLALIFNVLVELPLTVGLLAMPHLRPVEVFPTLHHVGLFALGTLTMSFSCVGAIVAGMSGASHPAIAAAPLLGATVFHGAWVALLFAGILDAGKGFAPIVGIHAVMCIVSLAGIVSASNSTAHSKKKIPRKKRN